MQVVWGGSARPDTRDTSASLSCASLPKTGTSWPADRDLIGLCPFFFLDTATTTRWPRGLGAEASALRAPLVLGKRSFWRIVIFPGAVQRDTRPQGAQDGKTVRSSIPEQFMPIQPFPPGPSRLMPHMTRLQYNSPVPRVCLQIGPSCISPLPLLERLRNQQSQSQEAGVPVPGQSNLTVPSHSTLRGSESIAADNVAAIDLRRYNGT